MSFALTAALAVLAQAAADAPAPAPAEPVSEVKQGPWADRWAEPPTTYINFRIGGATGTYSPEICAELGVWRISVEGCGTGGGFLHNNSTPELTHFLAKFRITSTRTPIGWLETRVAAGFAELSVGSDDGGFNFAGTNATRTSTAGPEIGTSLRLAYPLWVGFELLAELRATLGFFAYGPKLVTPQNVVVPAAGLSIGAGW